jgi:type IV secretion system protein VirB10
MARRTTERQPGPSAADALPAPTDAEAKVVDLATRQVVPAVAQRSGRDWSELYAGIAVVAVLGAVTLWMVYGEPQPRNSAISASNAQAGLEPGTVPLPDLPLPPGAPGQAPLSADLPGEAATQGALSTPDLAPVLAQPPGSELAGTAPTDLPAEEPVIPANPHSSPTVVFDAGQGDASTIMVPDGIAVRQPALPKARSSAPAPSARSTLTRGTLIPAVLETPIDMARPGFVRAIVSSDVRSSNGATVLVARSTRLIGEYRSEGAGAQKRATIVWTRMTGPDGASQDLGTAVTVGLTSVIAGLGAAPGQADRVRQGEPVRVLVARDLELTRGR